MVPQESLDSHRSSLADDKKISELKAHTGYTLHVHLKQGHDLPAKDSCGTSDPYVKFLFRGKQVHKSKTIFKDLNPFWDEKFTLNIDDPFVPLEIKVRATTFPYKTGGVETGSMYMEYVPVISANIPCTYYMQPLNGL